MYILITRHCTSFWNLQKKIKEAAREYVKEVYGGDTDFIDEAEQVLTWLSTRYCLVDKSRLEEPEIAYRAKEYNHVVLDKRDIDYLFPSIAKEVEG